ncbi:MAG: DUF1186 domain-containing protein [Verrucomicrobia bacterium]|nr:DUF1186 domain-containing protein [Verrucomicrobiota bacterium]
MHSLCVVGYYRRLFHGKLKRVYSHAWNGLVCAVADLPAPELLAEVRQAYEEGLVDPAFARLGPQEVIADGAGGQTATAANLAHRQMVFMFESEDFLDLTHGFWFSCHWCRLVVRRHPSGSLSSATPLLRGRFGPFRTPFRTSPKLSEFPPKRLSDFDRNRCPKSIPNSLSE